MREFLAVLLTPTITQSAVSVTQDINSMPTINVNLSTLSSQHVQLIHSSMVSHVLATLESSNKISMPVLLVLLELNGTDKLVPMFLLKLVQLDTSSTKISINVSQLDPHVEITPISMVQHVSACQDTTLSTEFAKIAQQEQFSTVLNVPQLKLFLLLQ